MKKSIIYTRKGDRGQTSLIGGKCVSKSSARIEAYGTVDELNSQIGLLAAMMTDADEISFLTNIQRDLFNIGTLLATEVAEGESLKHFETASIDKIERRIDLNDSMLQPLKAFILPGGSAAASVAHVCRTVCRRAERRIIALSEECPVDDILQCYINRLSDYLFVLARKLNLIEKIEEKNL